MMDFKLKYQKNYPAPVLGLHWNAHKDKILIAWGSPKKLTIELINSKGLSKKKASLSIDDKLKSLSLDESASLALLIFEQKVLVFDFEKVKIIHELKRKEGFLGGGFVEREIIYLKIPAPSGSVDWSIWNVKNNAFQEYELERYGHYGRAAILHPSKKLIGTCWSAYESGFLIHKSTAFQNKLYYFHFGEKECSRPEYEAYAPSFNQRGNKIAFVVNPYIGGQKNIEKLCVYAIENPSKSLCEIELCDSKKETVKRAFFLPNDDFILLDKTRSVVLVDLRSLERKKILQNKVDAISVNTATGAFAVVQETKLSIYFNDYKNLPAPYSTEEAMNFAKAFLLKHQDKLTVAGH